MTNANTAKITIRNLNGPVLREAIHDGHRFIGGTLGQSYAIQVENLTGGRILAVITVDGRNVLDASPGDHAGPGYVIGGRQTFNCEGWRTSDTSVAEFTITSAEKSYAAGTLGDANNVGVIGVAVFTEGERMRDGRTAVLRPATRGGEAMRSAGTGFGAERESRVTSTTFKRTATPEVHVIRYDTIDALASAGLLPATVPSIGAHPFPATAPAYCPRPLEAR